MSANSEMNLMSLINSWFATVVLEQLQQDLYLGDQTHILVILLKFPSPAEPLFRWLNFLSHPLNLITLYLGYQK